MNLCQLQRILFLGIFALSCWRGTESAENGSEVVSLREIDASVQRFASDLFFEAVRQNDKNGNLFLSPWSIYSALSLTLAGTGGETERELLQGLRLDSSRSAQHLHSTLGQWQRDQLPGLEEEVANTSSTNSSGSSGVVASLANKIFVEKTLQVHQQFVDLLKRTYHADLSLVDFMQKSEESRVEINKWVEAHTAGKIIDLIPPSAIDSLTRMVLANAVYFKGQWLVKFNKSETEADDFHCLDTSSPKKVQMMRLQEKLQVAQLPDLKSRLLWLPFSDNDTQAAILLPDERDGLTAVEEQLRQDSSKLSQILSNSAQIDHREVIVRIPRLKIESFLNLKQLLEERPFHMKSLFDFSRANFSSMTSEKGLAVSGVFHKAVFEMDEEGATAAAATSVVSGIKSAPQQESFLVDHPFLLLLLNRYQIPLFIGRVACVKN